MNKKDWKTQVRKTQYMKGKKLSKKELGEMAQALTILEGMGVYDTPKWQKEARKDLYGT